jgi:hypothetical protein
VFVEFIIYNHNIRVVEESVSSVTTCKRKVVLELTNFIEKSFVLAVTVVKAKFTF